MNLLVLIKDTSFAKKLYLLSLVFLGLPPFFAFYPFLNINSLAKLIWLTLFVGYAFGFIESRRRTKGKVIVFLFFFLLFAQTISIINAVNVFSFLSQYEDLFFTGLFVVVSVNLVNKIEDIRNIIIVLLSVSLVSLFIQFSLFFHPDFFLSLIKPILHPDYFEIISINVQRNRIYLEAYDEALIPIIFYLISNRKGRNTLVYYIYSLAVAIFSFLSNFRTRFIMLLFAFSSSIFSFFGVVKKKSFSIIVVLIVVMITLTTFLNKTIGYSVIDRITFQDKQEDVVTTTGRIKMWEKAAQIGLAFPVFGAGLGNYYDYTDPSMKQTISIFEQTLKEFQLASFYPHNIFFQMFAETGFLGFLIFLLAVFYFVKKDKRLIKEQKKLSVAFIISFWTLFIYAMFNPFSSTKFLALFWLMRILIEKSESVTERLAI